MSNFLKALGICIAVSGCVAGRIFAQSAGWQNISHEIKNGICVLEDRADPRAIYLGTAKGLYKTEDAGLTWKRVLSNMDMAINQIASDPSDTRYLFAATSKGVYASQDAGETWKRIYGAGCAALSARQPVLYAGTEQGLMVSTDAGAHWNKESGALGKKDILAIAADATKNGNIYAVATDGVYRRGIETGPWEKVYSASVEEVLDGDDDSRRFALRSICVDPEKGDTVYIATAAGVFTSHDGAATWEKLTEYGLSAHGIRCVAVGQGSLLYAATRSDVFCFAAGNWHRVGDGMTSRTIQAIAGGTGHLYAACDTGLYSIGYICPQKSIPGGSVDVYTAGLPPIGLVQRAAIAYADVDIKKIEQWRRQARKKAMLPSVRAGINKNSSDLWHWEGGSTTKECDDVLRKGREVLEWDVDMSWDLGELIWNDSQTSIDTRARLLVQLRGDIIDEVTKLYFEFVRIRKDMDSLSLMDKKKLFEKEVRLKELAAQIDGLTDGFFSRYSP